MTYDFIKGINIYGEPNSKQLFTYTFGEIPCIYTYSLEDSKLDISDIDIEKVHSIYPECKYRYNSNNDVEDEDEDDDGIPMDELSVESAAQYYVIYTNVGIFEINRFKIDYLHPNSIKPEVEIKKLLSCIPAIPNTGKSTEVGVVCVSQGDYWVSRDSDSRINYTDVDISKNYNDNFPEIHNKIIDFLNPENRRSGLILLHGLAGTGKTTMIKNFISKYPNNYIYITSSMAAHLADPEFTSFLMSNKNSVFILEDCEAIVMDRTDSNVAGAISALLNMADGIMSDIFNGKFICTFNTELDNIDKALLRPGRCIVNYEFQKLCAEKTKVLLNERGIELDSYEPMTLADIYNYEDAKMNEPKKKIGF